MLSKTSYVAIYNSTSIVVSLDNGVTNTTRSLALTSLIYLSVFNINSIFVSNINYCYVHNFTNNTTTQLSTVNNVYFNSIVALSQTTILATSSLNTYSILSTTVNDRYLYNFGLYYI